MNKGIKNKNMVDSYIKIAKNISNDLEKDLSPILEPIEDYLKH